jgi:hypothetical protein
MSDTNVNTPRLRPEYSNRSYRALQRCMRRARLRYWFRVIAGALALSGCASGAIAAEPAKPAEVSQVAPPKEASWFWNQPIIVSRVFAATGGAGGTSRRRIQICRK